MHPRTPTHGSKTAQMKKKKKYRYLLKIHTSAWAQFKLVLFKGQLV